MTSSPSTRQTDFFNKLTSSIDSNYRNDVQNRSVYEAKQQAIAELTKIARRCNNARDFKDKLRIWLTGSSINGFGNKNSDADMCMITGGVIPDDGEPMTRKSIINLLYQIKRNLEYEKYLHRRSEVIPAKVPILRVYLDIPSRERASRGMVVQCDINVDNHIGIRNSWLLRCYSELDDRMRPFIYMIKYLAKSANLNDAQSGSLSTYSWLLLAISFLQIGLKDPVLPIIQEMTCPKDKKTYDWHFKQANLEQVTKKALEIKNEIKWKSKNTMNVGELFYRFIYYYAVSFNFSDWIISVRTGKLFQRFGDDSLVRLKDSIRALEESEREREMMRRQAEKQKQEKEKSKDGSSKQKQENVHSRLGKRPRLNSGIYVKKDENSVVTITDSEDEESENNRTSIIKNDKNNSSDSEDHGLGVYLC